MLRHFGRRRRRILAQRLGVGRTLVDYKEIGELDGYPVFAKNGRYGPYVSHDGVNATLPNDITPDAVTLEQAVALVDARAEKTGGRPAKRTAKRTAKRAPAKKAAASAS